MQIFGNPKTSNKFFVYLNDGSLIWTSNFNTAIHYITNQRYQNWYNKPLYCTNEEIVIGYDNKLYLKSKCPEDPNQIKPTYDNKQLFLLNAKKHIKDTLDKILFDLQFDSLFELYTYKDSKIKKYKDLCKKVLTYRDDMYLFTEKILDKYKDRLIETVEVVDLSDVYDDFLTNFPKFNDDESR